MNTNRLEQPLLPNESGWLTRERLLVLVLGVATVIALVLCFLLVQPFVPVIAWALALAIVARPLHQAIAARIPNADIAAGVAVILVALLILVPTAFVVQNLIREAAGGAKQIQAEAQDGRWLEQVEGMPWIGPAFQWARDNVNLDSGLQQVAGFLAGSVSHALVGTLWVLVQTVLVLFTLYFFFRDRDKALRVVRSLMPLSDAETDEVFKRIDDTIHATIYGSLLVACIQGTLGGLMFWWLGLSSPVVWGAIMALLALVPNMGAFVIWGPAATILFLKGDWTKGLILAAWGATAVSLIDNLLYPFLVGQRMRLNTLVVFFAILGGILVLGGSGIVLGPVIVVITIALVDVWRRRVRGGQPAEVGVGPANRTELLNR